MGLFDKGRDNASSIYACGVCEAPITLDRVSTITRSRPPDQKLNVIYTCSCRATAITGTFAMNLAALVTLFGSREAIEIPYTPSLHPTAAVAPTRTVPRRQALMEAWQWETAQLASAHEFLLFCRGPYQRDDEVAEQFREKWQC